MRLLYMLLPVCLLLVQCISEKKADDASSWIQPQAGNTVKLGDKVELQVQVPAGSEVDSIVYFVDTLKIASAKDVKPISVSTDSLPLGNRILIARIYKGGGPEEITTTMTLISAEAPEKFTYRVVQTFPHDTSSYTQGLAFDGGFFYESDGGDNPETGYSSLRRVEPSSGEVLQKVDLPKETFAEGLAVVNDKIIQLTWTEGKGIVYDKTSFKKLGEFPYQSSREGWGLCFDGKRLIKSDGSNYLYFLNKNDYHEEGFIEVYDDKGPVDSINELEFIDGKVYANVYQTNKIIVIDPENGMVTAEIDLTDILPLIYRYPDTNVLNGIAWDSQNRRLFVTGKRWAKLFEIELRVINQGL